MNISTEINKINLSRLYESGKSMKQIAEEFKCSEHKIVYWMVKYGIKRRNRSNASYIRSNPNGNPFSIKKTLSYEENKLFGLGLGIYWGEGEKVSRHQLRVTNTDPDILKTYIRFLLEICQIKREKITYSIICFNDTSPKDALSYWSKELEISDKKFGKIVQIPPQGKGTYKRKNKTGICTVTVSNVKLKMWIMGELEKLKMPG